MGGEALQRNELHVHPIILENLLFVPTKYSDVLPRTFTQSWDHLMSAHTDPLQLTSSIREYGEGHQHGGYLAFLEIAASMAISVNTITHQQCF